MKASTVKRASISSQYAAIPIWYNRVREAEAAYERDEDQNRLVTHTGSAIED